MSPRNKIILVITVLLAATLSCDYLPSPDSAPTPGSEDAIATAVAATVAAGGDALSAPEPTGEISLAPNPTLEPVPVAPLTPTVVYVKDGDLYYWEEGNPPTSIGAVGDAYDVRLSPDGAVVAFTRGPDWYNQELWAVNTDGSNLRQLVSQATLGTFVTSRDAISARIHQYDFVPGTHNVAFSTQLTYEGPGLFLNDDLRVVNADTSALATVLAPGSGGNFYYSPDGSQVGLSTPTQISVVNADGTNRRDLLSFPLVITYSEYQYYPSLRWTLDGSALRAAIPAEDPLAASPDPTHIWHLPVDGSPPSSLFSVTPVPFFQHTPSLSRDTSRVAYLVEISAGSPPNLELHLVNIDGTGDMIYATGPLQFQAWATDGVYFIYTDGSPNPKIGQYGAGPINLPGVTNLVGVSWISPTRFILQDKSGANFQLWLGGIGSPSILIDSTPGERISYDYN